MTAQAYSGLYNLGITQAQKGKRVEKLGKTMLKSMGSGLKRGRKKTKDKNRLKENGRIAEVDFEMMLLNEYLGFRK